MSIECAECERDLRGGHATTCSRVQSKPPCTHSGHKSSAQIKAQCKALGLTYDDHEYRNGGDWIYVRGGGAFVAYNTTTGDFSGTTDEGVQFSSRKTDHDNEPWFQALLDFFLVGRKEPAHG